MTDGKTQDPGWLEEVRWNSDGLVLAVAQDWRSGRVLMCAWMNREALRRTANEGMAVYWSRSRRTMWQKGETSGNRQRVHELFLDCDGDTILLRVEQMGGIACHTGRESCLYRRLQGGEWIDCDPVLRNPEDMYGSQ